MRAGYPVTGLAATAGGDLITATGGGDLALVSESIRGFAMGEESKVGDAAGSA